MDFDNLLEIDSSTILEERISIVTNRAVFLQGKKDSIDERVKELTSEVESIKKTVGILEKTTKVLSLLEEKMIQKDLKDIDNLVNYGLKVVFPDRDLRFESTMVPMGNKMVVDFATYDKGKKISADAFGSVSVIESLILRTISLMKTNTFKMLLLDETFGALDGDYVQQLGLLLKTLAEKAGLDILLVSFNGLLSDADTLLRAKLNPRTLELHINSSKEEVQHETAV